MPGGGSGECLIIHVKLIVDPVLMNNSGPPRMDVMGSANKSYYVVTMLDISIQEISSIKPTFSQNLAKLLNIGIFTDD